MHKKKDWRYEIELLPWIKSNFDLIKSYNFPFLENLIELLEKADTYEKRVKLSQELEELSNDDLVASSIERKYNKHSKILLLWKFCQGKYFAKHKNHIIDSPESVE